MVFDTGSEYLAVTSALCDDATAGNYKFKVYDADNNDFIDKKVANRCATAAYDMHKSEGSKILSRSSSKLAYGTADAQGFIWQDYACLQQSTGKLSLAEMQDSKCSAF